MSYTNEWLEDPNRIPIVIIEVSIYNRLAPIIYSNGNIGYGREETLLFSTHGFTTSSGSFTVLPLINEDIVLSETLNKTGSSQISFGDISLNNINGELDSYLDFSIYTWVNRSIKIYYGDLSWTQLLATTSDLPSIFLTVFNGIIGNLDSKNSKVLNITIRDKLIKLDTPISENKIGEYGAWLNGQSNQATLRPIVFGEVFNISPLIISAQFQDYMFSCSVPEQLNGVVQNGAAERVLEIRDNGYPIWPVKPRIIFNGLEFRLLDKYTKPQQPLTITLDETYTPPVQYYQE
jgi:hypothetical protein